MSKTLAFIALAGFLLCLVFFTLAFLIAGDQIFESEKPFAGIRPLIDMADRKEWRWNGGDTLAVEAPDGVALPVQRKARRDRDGDRPTLLAHVKVGEGRIATDKGHRGGPRQIRR